MNRGFIKVILFWIFFIIISPALAGDIYIDQRLGANLQEYGIRKVGKLLWLEKNASYPVKGSLCHALATSSLKCAELGRLYSWPQAQLACDKKQGWRVANDNDWRSLELFMGMKASDTYIDAYGASRGSKEGDQLKQDSYFGFDQASGYIFKGKSLGLGNGDNRSYFWSVNIEGKFPVYYRRNIRVNTPYIHRFSNQLATYKISVRCVKETL